MKPLFYSLASAAGLAVAIWIAVHAFEVVFGFVAILLVDVFGMEVGE